MKASFIEPMLLLRTNILPEGPDWRYELKLDGYRALAIKTNGKVQLRSRNNNDFSLRYPAVVKALAEMPGETVIDGEVVAFDDSGRPSFNRLQNYGSSRVPIFYYAFDVPILAGRDLRSQTLDVRRDLLRTKVLSKLQERVRYSPVLDANLSDLIRSVREQGLEGLVAKRSNSVYESGQRSGAWRKMRINQGQEFVIGGYTPSPKNFDALIFGYYKGKDLMYVARTRNGFTPALREHIFKRFRGLEVQQCPFVNLPEARGGRWGQGLPAAKMKECRWLKPVLVGQFEFTEWTPDDHLRHSRFVAFREDKPAQDVHRER
ncbi:MAG: non-homologous end-joining DNA ligase [Bryobacteraceae bacterium]